MKMKKTLLSMAVISALSCCGAEVYADATSIETMNEELIDLHSQAQDIQNAADAEERELTEDENGAIDELMAKFKTIEASIARRERINAATVRLSSSNGRKSDPSAAADPVDPVRPNAGLTSLVNHKEKGKNGFRDFGEFSKAVCASAGNGATVDPRLMKNAPTTFSSEGVGADGGFEIPPDFRTEIMTTIEAETSLLGMTDGMTSSSNTLVLPRDDVSQHDGSNGVQAYWEGEAGQIDQSKMNLKQNIIRLHKLTSLVPVTEELISDGSAIDSYLRRKVPEKFDFKINDAIINGTGAGMLQGINKSGALVTVAKESGQVAGSLVFENIINMWSRMSAADRKNAVWLINQDIEPQLLTMSFEGASSSVPAYMPAGGLSGAPYGTLMGRPVMPIESCQALGTAGDIMLVNMKQYLTAMKTGGMRTDVSMHLWFDYDVMAYRFIMRIAGETWRKTPITALNGGTTRSPFVRLATRA